MIELKDFTKNYGDFTATRNVSFRFEKNLITGILGPNGAGKTTILKAVCARHFPTEGKVLIDSERYGKIDSALEPEKVRNITGFVEENARFPEDFTVSEHLAEVCDLHSADRKNIDEAVCLFSLEEWRKPEKILKNCTLIAAVRNDTTMEEMEEKRNELMRRFGGNIILLPFARMSISSSEIRKRVAEGKSIRYMVPDAVKDYIEEKGFYRG